MSDQDQCGAKPVLDSRDKEIVVGSMVRVTELVAHFYNCEGTVFSTTLNIPDIPERCVLVFFPAIPRYRRILHPEIRAWDETWSAKITSCCDIAEYLGFLRGIEEWWKCPRIFYFDPYELEVIAAWSSCSLAVRRGEEIDRTRYLKS